MSGARAAIDRWDRAGGAGGRDGEGGLALVLCLLVLTILIVLVTQFAYGVKVEERIARNSKDDAKAFFAARGALAYVRAWLREDRRAESPADSLREDWASGALSGVKVGDADVFIRIEDCDRALNVNLLAGETTKVFARGALERLCARLRIENAAEVAGRIADWIDRDAEGDYEIAGARNGPIVHVDELLEIPEIPPEAFFGPPLDASALEAGDPAAAAAAARGGLLSPTPYLTAWGSGKINVNTAPEDLLFAILPEEKEPGRPFPPEEREEAVRKILEYRGGASSGGAAGSAETGAGTGTGGGAGGEGEEDEPPGKDIARVDELAQIAPELGPLLRAGQPPPGPGGTGDTGAQPKPFREMVGVAALDFRVALDVTAGPISTTYEAILRRGEDAFHTLLWREVPK